MKIKFKLDIVLEGEKSDILTIKFLDEDDNEFGKVLDQYEDSKDYSRIIDNIADRIQLMADKYGIVTKYFKDEGPNNVHRFRIPEEEKKKINKTKDRFRLLCLVYGKFNIIIGGAAIKLSGTDTYQENPEYHRQVKICQAVDKALEENEVDFSRLIDYKEQIFEIELL